MRTHQTQLEITSPIEEEVDVGGTFALTVRVWCPSGCELHGRSVNVLGADGAVVATGDLATHVEKINESEEIIVHAPLEVGEHAWSLVFPRHESGDLAHEESILPILFHTKPHQTSAAVWDVPSPVAINSAFRIKVGARCSVTCELAGQGVDVRDETGTKVGEGKLGEQVWEGTRALYWTDVELTAPATRGSAEWTIGFTGAGMSLAHSEGRISFSFKVDPPPQHRITITVVGIDTGAPLSSAEVRLGVYRSVTDESGVASFKLPRGDYELKIWRDGYKGPPMTVQVNEDVVLTIEALKTLTAAEMDEELERYEASQWG